MANSISQYLCFTIAFAIFIGVSFGQGYVNPRNPCHPAKRLLGAMNTCRVYRLPPEMCQKCKLRPDGYDKRGKFEQCTNIYDIQNPGCVDQLKLYAKWNRRCDKLRYNQITNSFNTSLVQLDYFVYSVCEECCDCVSTGSRLGQYNARNKTGTLFQYRQRANCGTHAAADICLVWPKVRTVVNWWKQIPPKAVVDKMPDVCTILRNWREERKDPNYPMEQRKNVPMEALPFLRNFSKAARCGSSTVWNECVDLETKQRRI